MAIPFAKAATIIEASFAPCICHCREQEDRVVVELYREGDTQPLQRFEAPQTRVKSVRDVAQWVLEIRQALSAPSGVSLNNMIGEASLPPRERGRRRGGS